MSSSILPNGRKSVFPFTPYDGQAYVDSEMVKWIYDSTDNVWVKSGKSQSIQLASSTNDGLLSASDKALLDRTPTVIGGFGIIVDTKYVLHNADNPAGVISGDIELVSDSLDIECVTQGTAIGGRLQTRTGSTQTNGFAPDPINPAGTDPNTIQALNLAGLRFKLSDKMLKSLIVNVKGPKGPKGDKGETGPTGKHGFSYMPKGDKGKKGTDVVDPCELTGVEYDDVDGLTDTALVNLRVFSDHGCKMVATIGKLNTIDNQPADKILATQLIRSVVYPEVDDDTCNSSRLNDWTLTAPANDTTKLDLQLLRLSDSAHSGDPAGFNGTMALSSFVEGIVAEYIDRLTKIDEKWGAEVKQYIQSVDSKARGILSSMANQLSMCEFNLPAVEYCITFRACQTPLPPA